MIIKHQQYTEIVFLLIILISIQITSETNSEPDYYRYLQQYGYTPKVEGRRIFSIISRSSYTEAILKLQRFHKLPETGILDERTKILMQKARCGNPDLGTYDSIARPVNVDVPESLSSKVQGRSGKTNTPASYSTHIWPKKQLKWFIEAYPREQKSIRTKDHIRQIINEAFDDWEKYSGLKFQMVENKNSADLRIKFLSKDHEDGFPFDGQGGTLAHAFYPRIGDIHFDDDEYFTDDYTNDYDHYTLRLVAAHEIGHALGLNHSSEDGSLMYPIYQQFNKTYHLPMDDQYQIQKLYGKSEIKSTTKSPRTTTLLTKIATPYYSSNRLPMDNWCSGEFQTGCEGPDGELYLFKDSQVWRYQARKKHIWDSEPKLISQQFPSLSDRTIEICVKSTLGYTYLFSHSRLWKIKTHWAIDGPFILNAKQYPSNARVALLHQNSIYLIRNHLAYRLNELDYNQELEIRPINTILKSPPDESIQSGFTYNKNHYIFTNLYVYVYDSTYGNLLPGYPKYKSNGWFACESSLSSQVPKERKEITPPTTTMKPLTTQSHQKQEHHDEDEDDHHFHHHHHHHHHRHHHRPRRPWHHRHRPPHDYYHPLPPNNYFGPPPPPPPHEYRRRWEY